MAKKNLSIGTGRRKTAVARVCLREGSGAIKINGRAAAEYFGQEVLTRILQQALEVTNNVGKLDILVTVQGGGINGQAEAIRHGIARALRTYDDTNRASLRANGFLTRDSRMVERKKYGQRKARRRFQFSKR